MSDSKHITKRLGNLVMGTRKSILVVLLLAFLVGAVVAIWEEVNPEAASVGTEQAAGLDGAAHDPFPFGRMNPKAPLETTQFAFMIGEFDCVDRKLQPDGTWKETRGEWNATYVMDGYAILDQYRIYETGFTTSNMRIFDDTKGKWTVTYFQMPRYMSLTVDGQKVGDELVMTRGEEGNGEQYIFYEITEDGYKWRLERTRDEEMIITWETFCTRRK